MHTKGQKSWKHVEKPTLRLPFTLGMESEPSAATTGKSAINGSERPVSQNRNASDQPVSGDEAICWSDGEQAVNGVGTVSQRMRHLGKKSPRAFHVLADVVTIDNFLSFLVDIFQVEELLNCHAVLKFVKLIKWASREYNNPSRNKLCHLLRGRSVFKVR